jgi:hypothetical protein
MAFTFIAAVGNNDGAAGTTLDATSSLNVAAGDLLIGWGKYEGTNDTFAIAKTTGGNDFTFDAGDEINHTNNDLNGSFGYKISASADATFTPRLTTGSRAFRSLIVLQFRPDAGETVTKDGSNKAEGSTTAINSGNITTTGTDGVVVGAYGPYSARDTNSELIDGVAATEPTNSPQGFASAWYRILTAAISSGAATATIGGAEQHIEAVIAFKSEAGGTPNDAFVTMLPMAPPRR